METTGSRLGSVVAGLIAIVAFFGIPVFFLWVFIRETFDFLPSTHSDLMRILENDSHGTLFYIFAGIVIVWILYKSVVFILGLLQMSTIAVSSRSEFGSQKEKWSAVGLIVFWTAIIIVQALPFIAYIFLAPDITLKTIANFIGTFEGLILPIVIIEGFILDIPLASFVVRILLYGYLLLHFT